jgi:hypothetical protein
MEAKLQYRSPRGFKSYRASGAERLARLADFLDEVPPERLTFSWWYGNGKGCAVALAAAEAPWFKAQGLALADDDKPTACHPVYDGATEWRAVSRFFEIGVDEARCLFASTGYDGNLRPRPHEVAGKIREFLAAKTLAA